MTSTGWPATVNVAVRAAPRLASTWNVRRPDPVTVVGGTREIQGTSDSAVHEHVSGAA